MGSNLNVSFATCGFRIRDHCRISIHFPLRWTGSIRKLGDPQKSRMNQLFERSNANFFSKCRFCLLTPVPETCQLAAKGNATERWPRKATGLNVR